MILRSKRRRVELAPIRPDGTSPGVDEPPVQAVEAIAATVALYEKAGYEEPWISYLARRKGAVVGICGFKTPPAEGRVEIAYYTFPEFEGSGVGTEMARGLVVIARAASPGAVIAAQTLPAESASTAILRKLGFEMSGELDHEEDGKVWEWRLPREAPE